MTAVVFDLRFAKARPDWFDQAECRGLDPALFFAEKPGDVLVDAMRTCQGCPVREDCLEWAIETGEKSGVWGGLSAHQRDQLVRRRRRQGRVA